MDENFDYFSRNQFFVFSENSDDNRRQSVRSRMKIDTIFGIFVPFHPPYPAELFQLFSCLWIWRQEGNYLFPFLRAEYFIGFFHKFGVFDNSFHHNLLKLNIFRCNGVDVGTAFEVFDVEGQQIFDVVRFHRGGDFCVVDLNAGNRMFDDKFALISINFNRIG